MDPRENLKAFLDAELSQEEMREMEAALAADPELASEAELYQAISSSLRHHAEIPVEGLGDTLKALQKRRGNWVFGNLGFAWGLSLATASVVIVGAIIFPVFSQAKMAAKTAAFRPDSVEREVASASKSATAPSADSVMEMKSERATAKARSTETFGLPAKRSQESASVSGAQDFYGPDTVSVKYVDLVEVRSLEFAKKASGSLGVQPLKVTTLDGYVVAFYGVSAQERSRIAGRLAALGQDSVVKRSVDDLEIDRNSLKEEGWEPQLSPSAQEIYDKETTAMATESLVLTLKPNQQLLKVIFYKR